MKLSKYITDFMEKISDSVFLVSGGGVMHIVDSIGRSKLHSYCCHNEQGAAKAAEGYARIKSDVGLCVVTTGPGGTNAITGVAASWVDNIPMIVISGQVRIPLMIPENKKPRLRQVGPQEINIIDIVKPITKYAVVVKKPEEIKYHLEKAYHTAKSGKPGPVWLDIPLDVQCAEVDEKKLKGFNVAEKEKSIAKIPIKEIVRVLNNAKKPLMIVGHGIWLAKAENELMGWIKKVRINVVSAMSGDDLVSDDYPYYLGAQGLTGLRSANYAMDNCDVLLVVGTRMQIRQTSFEFDEFKKWKKIIMVDIDKMEFDKVNIKTDIAVCADAKDFLEAINNEEVKLKRWDVEPTKIEYKESKDYIDIYQFYDELNKYNEYDVITSNGMTAEVTEQALRQKNGKRKITNTAFGEMGHGLPTALGASVARGEKPVVCLEGDGSIMMNIQEIQTIKYHKIPIKIFIFNNGGYFSIRNTHTKFFGKVFAADESSGLSLPNWKELIQGWGLKYECIGSAKDLGKVKKIIESKETVICELKIDPQQKMLEKWGAGMLREE